jgi:hypothetical protein
MVMRIIIKIITGHECIWGTVQGRSAGGWQGKGNDGVKREEKDIYIYDDNIKKPTKHSFKEVGKGRRGMRIQWRG